LTFNPVIPNRATENDIRTYFIQRGTDALQRMAGYTPQTMDTIAPINVFSPLPEKLLLHADDMINEACYETLANCNPRVPYLLSLWMYMGQDFEHHLLRYKFDHRELGHVKNIFKLLYDDLPGLVAFNSMSEEEIVYSIRIGIDYITEYAGDAVRQAHIDEVDLPSIISRKEREWLFQDVYNQTRDEAEMAISDKTLEWAHLTDDEVLVLCVDFAWQLYDMLTTGEPDNVAL
jgi:hypothetical protein